MDFGALPSHEEGVILSVQGVALGGSNTLWHCEDLQPRRPEGNEGPDP
jgi:hypothetical protein